MSLDFTDDQSTLVQVMAWCRQATSHFPSQCWPRSLSPYGVTKPQWVKIHLPNTSCNGLCRAAPALPVLPSNRYFNDLRRYSLDFANFVISPKLEIKCTCYGQYLYMVSTAKSFCHFSKLISVKFQMCLSDLIICLFVCTSWNIHRLLAISTIGCFFKFTWWLWCERKLCISFSGQCILSGPQIQHICNTVLISIGT